MPLFVVEINRRANAIGASDLTFRLHTAAPTDASPTNGRTTMGGGAYEAGVIVTPANISNASDGDITFTAGIAFGAADEAVGTVTHWSAYRGTDPVAFGTVPSTVIANGDSFTINANSLVFDGSST